MPPADLRHCPQAAIVISVGTIRECSTTFSGRLKHTGLALVDVEREFGNTIIPFILDIDRALLVCRDLSTSSHRLLYCLNVVGQFHAFPINDGQATTADMKIVTGHCEDLLVQTTQGGSLVRVVLNFVLVGCKMGRL